MSVHKKLMQARMRLQSMTLKKSGWNEYSKYAYFELEDFLPQIQMIFDDVGLCGVISLDSEIARLTITDNDDATQSVVVTMPVGSAALKGMHEIQQLGAVASYQRRYLWMIAMEIVEHDAIEQSRPDIVNELSAAKTLEELQKIFADAYRDAKGDEKKRVKTAYDKRKAELTEGA